MDLLWKKSIMTLRSRLALLGSDLESWQALTAADGPLKEHKSQVERVANVINGAVIASSQGTPLSGDIPSPSFDKLPDLRRTVGSISLIWDFFRDKFALRDLENLRRHLAVADDFAWDCYNPFLDAAVAADTVDSIKVKQPPLIFYSADRAPFAQARTKTFHPPGLDSKEFDKFINVLLMIPVPVIGLPWASANRIPDLVFVGHETGHVVTEDLGLKKRLKEIFETIPYHDDNLGLRRRCWASWGEEVFADLFGLLATGKSFVTGLAGELAGDVQLIQRAEINSAKPGSYPTPSLRIAICEDALKRKMKIDSDPDWTDIYGPPAFDAANFTQDVGSLVDALLDESWSALGNKTISQLLPWTDVMESNTVQMGNQLLNKTFPAATNRQLIAASMNAVVTNPGLYAQNKLDEWLAKKIFEKRNVGVRSKRILEARASKMAHVEMADVVMENWMADNDRSVGAEIATILGLVKNSTQ